MASDVVSIFSIYRNIIPGISIQYNVSNVSIYLRIEVSIYRMEVSGMSKSRMPRCQCRIFDYHVERALPHGIPLFLCADAERTLPVIEYQYRIDLIFFGR